MKLPSFDLQPMERLTLWITGGRPASMLNARLEITDVGSAEAAFSEALLTGPVHNVGAVILQQLRTAITCEAAGTR